MEYTLAAAAAALVAISVAGLQGLLSRRAYWYGLVAFAALTVVSDSVLVSRRLHVRRPLHQRHPDRPNAN
jgi:hypothetical protein